MGCIPHAQRPEKVCLNGNSLGHILAPAGTKIPFHHNRLLGVIRYRVVAHVALHCLSVRMIKAARLAKE